jgi:UDPglucose 6-dehydrogenase
MSQVPAGTSRKIYEKLNREVVYNPENLRLSQAIETYLNTDRQILGISSAQAKLRMQKFYSFYKNPLLFMSLESAELVKHSINSFLGLSISFINQIADLSESLNANITDVVNGMKTDTRIGQKAFLSPGLGFAGGTLGRDLRVLENLAKEKRVELPIIVDAYKVNQSRKEIFYKKLKKVFTKLPGKKIAILGLVYKPGTNTLRRSLSLEIGKWLVKQKVQVVGFDPALKEPKAVLPIKLCDNVYNAVKGSDAVIIITEWAEFKELDYKKIQSLVAKKIIFDTKNILQPELIKNLGFKYFGTGV